MPFAADTTISEWVDRWTSLPEEDVPADDLRGKPFENEHAARLKQPGQYRRFRRENDAFGSGIDAIWGIRRDNSRVELQAIRFDKTKFTVAQARKWLKDHDHAPILFEPASGTGGASDEGTESSADDGAPEDPKADKRVERTDDMAAPEKKDKTPVKDEKPKEDEKPVEKEPKPATAAPEDEPKPTVPEDKPVAPAVPEKEEDKPAVPEKTEKTDPIQKEATYHIFLADAQIVAGKADDGFGSGYVEGYASEFDKIDHQDEVVRKGAFVKTIMERGDRKIPLMMRHFASSGDIESCVGAVVSMHEDDYGLKFRAEYLPDEKSQELRAKVEALRAKNVRVGTSIGYRRMKWAYKDEDGRRILEHTEIAHAEITMTLKPANEGAFVTGGKDEKFVAAIKAVVDSKTEALDDKSRLLEEFGGRDDVAGLADRLEEFVGKLRDLLTDKPQDTEDVAGSTEKTAAPATNEVDLHLARMKVKDRERKLRMLELC